MYKLFLAYFTGVLFLSCDKNKGAFDFPASYEFTTIESENTSLYVVNEMDFESIPMMGTFTVFEDYVVETITDEWNETKISKFELVDENMILLTFDFIDEPRVEAEGTYTLINDIMEINFSPGNNFSLEYDADNDLFKFCRAASSFIFESNGQVEIAPASIDNCEYPVEENLIVDNIISNYGLATDDTIVFNIVNILFESED